MIRGGSTSGLVGRNQRGGGALKVGIVDYTVSLNFLSVSIGLGQPKEVLSIRSADQFCSEHGYSLFID